MCFVRRPVIGGNTDANELIDAEVFAAYKQQQQVG